MSEFQIDSPIEPQEMPQPLANTRSSNLNSASPGPRRRSSRFDQGKVDLNTCPHCTLDACGQFRLQFREQSPAGFGGAVGFGGCQPGTDGSAEGIAYIFQQDIGIFGVRRFSPQGFPQSTLRVQNQRRSARALLQNRLQLPKTSPPRMVSSQQDRRLQGLDHIGCGLPGSELRQHAARQAVQMHRQQRFRATVSPRLGFQVRRPGSIHGIQPVTRVTSGTVQRAVDRQGNHQFFRG